MLRCLVNYSYFSSFAYVKTENLNKLGDRYRPTVHKKGNMNYAAMSVILSSKSVVLFAALLDSVLGSVPQTSQLCPQPLHPGRRHWTWIMSCVPLMTEIDTEVMIQSISDFSLHTITAKVMVTYYHGSDTSVGQQSVNALCVDRISDKHKKALRVCLQPGATSQRHADWTSNHSLSPAATQYSRLAPATKRHWFLRPSTVYWLKIMDPSNYARISCFQSRL